MDKLEVITKLINDGGKAKAARVLAEVEQKLLKTNNPLKDCIVTKIVNYRVLLNANYQNMVNNARIREGKEANFQAKENWFVKVNDGFNGSIVAKKSDTNCKYLLFACNDAKVEKYLIDGIEATSEQIDTINKFKSKPSKNTNQGLDYDVVVRTIKIDGIKEIKCGNLIKF
jgi:hypothetical protein